MDRLPPALYSALDAIISTFESPPSDDSLCKLASLLPEKTILAALDLLDRQKVTLETTRWGDSYYSVLGSTSLSTVSLDLPFSCPTRVHCSCPAFTQSVLLSGTHLLCKHILAARLHRQLGLGNNAQPKSLSVNELLSRLSVQYPNYAFEES